MYDLVVAAHVVAGALGLLAGPVAALARRKERGLHTVAGWTYQVCCAVLCTTSFVFVAVHPAFWPFALIATVTQAAAVAGVVVRRRAWPGWVPLHVGLVLGSYVSFVTAFCVQTFGGLLAWVVPSMVGTAVVNVVAARVARTRPRPQRTAASASGSVKAPA